MKPEVQQQVRRRLRKIGGQVVALERMVEGERYCVDVLLQIAAVRGALDQAGKLLLEHHVETSSPMRSAAAGHGIATRSSPS